MYQKVQLSQISWKKILTYGFNLIYKTNEVKDSAPQDTTLDTIKWQFMTFTSSPCNCFSHQSLIFKRGKTSNVPKRSQWKCCPFWLVFGCTYKYVLICYVIYITNKSWNLEKNLEPLNRRSLWSFFTYCKCEMMNKYYVFVNY